MNNPLSRLKGIVPIVIVDVCTFMIGGRSITASGLLCFV